MKLNFNKKVFVLAFLLFLLILPQLTQAAGFLPDCADKGDCGLCDILATAIMIFRWILGILGGSALFLFVWHGFGWLTSLGNKEKIDATKKALVHTVIGLVIILASWLIVNLTIMLLVTDISQQKAGKFTEGLFKGEKAWYQYCAEEVRNAEKKESPCEQRGGQCQSGARLGESCSANGKNGTYASGLCPGTADNLCCVPN